MVQHGKERGFQPAGSASIDDFERLDIRVGRIVAAEPFRVDFGTGGARTSSAELADTYLDRAAFVGRLVVAVVNLAPRRVAGFPSQVLVLGALPIDGRIPLLLVDEGAP
jgi:tRNA-binding protein